MKVLTTTDDLIGNMAQIGRVMISIDDATSMFKVSIPSADYLLSNHHYECVAYGKTLNEATALLHKRLETSDGIVYGRYTESEHHFQFRTKVSPYNSDSKTDKRQTLFFR